MDDYDPITQKALFRFQVISSYLAADPPRGKRRQILEQLASKSWILQSGEVARVKAETIRYWLRLYRRDGFEALKDKPRSDHGIRAIPKEIIEEACKLKLQVPERSIERIITIMENMQLSPPGTFAQIHPSQSTARKRTLSEKPHHPRSPGFGPLRGRLCQRSVAGRYAPGSLVARP